MSEKMENYEELLIEILKKIAQESQTTDLSIPVGISNRHCHLSREDVESLFGKGYDLTKLKDLSQPGQYACKETIMICGPKGMIENVRILGPERKQTQVEVLQSDCFKLGIKAPLRLSGDLDHSGDVTMIGPKGSKMLVSGVVVAKRHIHMPSKDAKRFDVVDGENVSIAFDGARGGVLNEVIVRVDSNAGLECHIDVEEANALGVSSNTNIVIQKN